jgi:hypothetical protein
MSLGQLFMALGQEYNAKQIYFYFLTLRIVAVKRKKAERRAGARGMHESGAQASQLRASHRPWQDQIVEDYLHMKDSQRPVPVSGSTEFNAFFDTALRHIYATVLQDMRPPWMTCHMGEGHLHADALSLYTRPTFLMWNARLLLHTFGPDILRKFSALATSVSLKFVGVVARPLYVCTAQKEATLGSAPPRKKRRQTLPATPGSASGFCMNLASMSPLLQFPEEHAEWLCTACRKQRPGSASGSVPRRVLRLYPLVSTERMHSTPMRSGHVVALLYPPPVAFCWPTCATTNATPVDSPQPKYYKLGEKQVYEYEQDASDFIWQTASAFDELAVLC